MKLPESRVTRRQPAHARIPAAWDRLPAWRTLDSRGRDLVGFIMRAYRPPESGKPNAFELTDADAAALLDCSENTARSAVNACIERGWFILERKGGRDGPRGARSRVISLSMFPADNRDAEPQRFREWRPQPGSNIPRVWFTPSPWHGERRKNRGVRGAGFAVSKKRGGRGAKRRGR